jgi:uncharacterized protein (TIGR02145 family)
MEANPQNFLNNPKSTNMKMMRTAIWMIALSAVFSCQKEIETPVPGTMEGIDAKAGKPSGIKFGKVKDIDGNVYKTVKIGNQVWMAENLRVSRYRNGDPIPNVTDKAQWSSLTTGAWCHYDNQSANDGVYGKLYNAFAVLDSRGIAPRGWHVPTDEEWAVLISYLGGASVAGGKMKAVSSLWFSPNEGATNSSGFSGLPGGYRDYTGDFGSGGYYGTWWTSTDGGLYGPYEYTLQYDFAFISKSSSTKERGFSLRCIKD